MRKSLIIGLTAAALTVGSLGVIASERHNYENRQMHHLSEKLDLTQAQQDALAEQMKNKREQMRSLKKQRHELRSALTQLNPQAKDYQAQLDKLTKDAEFLARETVMQKAEQHKTLFSILTPQQRQEFAELKAERKAEREERMDDSRGHHGDKRKEGKHCK